MTQAPQFSLVSGVKLLLLVTLGVVWWKTAQRGNGYAMAVGWTVLTAAAFVLMSRSRQRQRCQHIDTAPLPRHLRAEVRQRYPHLSDAQLGDVEHGLRQFFQCHLRARQFVSMPSQVVDALWHAFILDTRAYQRFCQAAFGHFLHHSPAQTLGRDARRNDGLRRTWYHACRIEGIDPRLPTALPLLFALDTQLAILDGFRYVPDCRRIDQASGSGDYCGTSFGDRSASGDGDGFGGEAGHGGGDGADGGGGDGGGDGGGGCGGGGD